MSELEEVSFWPGSPDGSYSRVGPAGGPMVTCRRKTLLIVLAVMAVVFIIAVAVPAGMLSQYQKLYRNATATTSISPHKDVTTTTTTESSSHITDATAATTTTVPTPSELKWNKYRLPKTSEPSDYHITIDLMLFGDEQKDAVIPYNGTVTIHLKIIEKTDLIVIHSTNLTINGIKLQVDNDQAVVNLTGSFKYNPTLEQLEITLDKSYDANTEMKLDIDYNTTLNDKLNGFYKSSYASKTDDGKNKETVIATTQFESVFARRAFPCYDEPALKATFTLTVLRPKEWIALSNTKLATSTDVKDGKREQDQFETTPKMSTYLVAFVVSDFGHTETYNMTSISGNNIEITVYGQKSQITQLQFASDITEKIITRYEDFFNVSYPLSKVDIVAVPNFAAGAMENWGLITFSEAYLLFDPERSPSSTQQLVTYVVAHELAHQWFGNYVTMSWWNELWLNEGFATWVGKLIGTAHVKEEMGFNWPVEEDFKADVTRALQTDGLLSSHALSRPEESVKSLADIESMFDSITYVKGSAVLNMLDKYVTRNKTKEALQMYLQEHAYGSAKAVDLWAAFNQTTDSATDVVDVMTTWTSTVGYPKIVAQGLDLSSKSITISQTRYLVCSSCQNDTSKMSSVWDIPIIYDVFDPPSTDNQRLTSAEGSLKNISEDLTAESWYKLNSGWEGFYHVSYSEDALAKLNFDTLPGADQANLIFDTFMLFRSGEPGSGQSLIKLLDSAAKSEDGYLKWRMAIKAMNHVLKLYDQDYEKYTSIAPQLYKWLDVKALNLTYETVENMTIAERNVLNSRLSMALAIDHAQVHSDIPELDDLTKLFARNISEPFNATNPAVFEGVLHKDLINNVGQCAFLDNEEALWEPLWTKYNSSDVSSEQTMARIILSRGKNTMLLNRLLDYSLDEAKDEDTVSIIAGVSLNKQGRDIAWGFAMRNWDFLVKTHGDSGFTMSTLIKTPTKYFTKSQYLDQMEQFFSENSVGSGEVASRQALEIVTSNVNMAESGYKEIKAGLTKLQTSQ